jgi:hypothetical protein
MKITLLPQVFTIIALAGTLPAKAHDPKEHMEDAEKPNCTAMKGMDHSEMDKDDPVMKAMMKKCKKAMHDGETHESQDNNDNQHKGHNMSKGSAEHPHE